MYFICLIECICQLMYLILDLLCQMFGGQSLGNSVAFQWHYQLQRGQESLKDVVSRRPSIARVEEKICEVHSTVHMIYTQLMVSPQSCRYHVEADTLSSLMQKSVLYVLPHPFTEAKCQENWEICYDLILFADENLTILGNILNQPRYGNTKSGHKVFLRTLHPTDPVKFEAW